MADIKVNEKYVCGDSYFRVTTDDPNHPQDYLALSHSTDHANIDIGSGNVVVKHSEPMILEPAGYFNLPIECMGYGFFFFGDGIAYAEVMWDQSNDVTIVSSSSNVTDSNTASYFCFIDGGDAVRVQNNTSSAVRVIFDYYYTEIALPYDFKAFYEPSGVDNLDPELTINGTTVTPKFRYKGGDATATTWAPWGYGETLTRVSVATPPDYNDGSPGLGSNDDSVKFNDSDYYAYSGSGSQPTTGDLACEVVFRLNEQVASSRYLVSTYSADGVIVYTYNAQLVFYINSNGSAFVSTGAVLEVGCWYHVMFFVNRNEASTDGAFAYVNGLAAGSGADLSAIDQSLVSDNIALGAKDSGTNTTGDHLAYCALWESAGDWHQAGAAGPAEWATIAAERFAKFEGIYPQLISATYLPTTKTRAFNAYVDKYESTGYRKLYYVSSEWLRMCSRMGYEGSIVKGYLSETQNTNLIGYSEDFASNWTKIVAADTLTDDEVACPDGRVVAGSIIADNTDTTHGLSIAATVTSARYVFSVFVKPGDRDWIRLTNVTVLNCSAFFDIANGRVGYVYAGAESAHIEGPFYGGFYRCCLVFEGTAASHTFRIISADDDVDSSIQGDGLTVNTYFWGAQVEQSDYMTSPIRTSGGSPATRLKDQLAYDGSFTDDPVFGTIITNVLPPEVENDQEKGICRLAGTGGYIMLYVNGSAETRGYLSASPTGSVGFSTFDTQDGFRHEFKLYYAYNDTTIYVDGAAGDTDTAVVVPDDMTTLQIGSIYGSLANQYNGLISKFRWYGKESSAR